MCGATHYSAPGNALWAMVCHCRDCQRASGADHVSWLGLSRDAVTWNGPRRTYQSSPGVTRSFCGACGTPMSYETEDLPDETHVYAPGLDDLSIYRPTAHIYWSEHVPWLTSLAGLPRHQKGSKSPIAD
jgi:hypothetical protein